MFAPWLVATSLAHAEDVNDPLIEAELGKGITVHGNDDASFQIRGRLQERVTFEFPGGGDEPGVKFQVRRLRLVLLGKLPAQDLQIYIQLGFAPADMEADLLVPLRDAVVTWTPLRDLGLKVGQQKVPFNRERMVSSSALQFPDRSITNAELTLDRDIGAQVFSNDLFGWDERLAYQVGVFNGDGRNRAVGDLGLLYVARVEFRPLGAFGDSYIDADLERGAPRLVLAAGVARNMDAVRSRSTHGDVYELDGFTQDSAEADLMFKARGLALHAQGIVRRADADTVTGDVDGVPITETSRSAWGWSAALGYTFASGLEPAVRVAQVQPLPGHVTDVVSDQELRVGLSWYGRGHDLKLQTDYGYLGGDAHPDGTHEVRSQLQVYF